MSPAHPTFPEKAVEHPMHWLVGLETGKVCWRAETVV